MPIHSPRPRDIVELVAACGHLSLRMARMEEGKRYKIDVADPRHPTVYLSRGAALEELASVLPEIEARLMTWRTEQRRRDLIALPDAELADEEQEPDDDDEQAATGTDGVTEFAARVTRLSFGLVRGGSTD